MKIPSAFIFLRDKFIEARETPSLREGMCSRAAHPAGQRGGVQTLLVLFLCLLGGLALFRPIRANDTYDVLKGVDILRTCLAEGHWVDCERFHPPVSFNAPLRFPLIQVVPGLFFSALGLSHAVAIKILVFASFLSFCGALYLLRRGLRSHPERVRRLAFLLMITGPLIYYARASFGEMTAAFLILFYTLGCIENFRPRALVLLTVLAGVTKEVAFPFLGLIAFTVSRSRRTWLSVMVGCLGSIILNAGFNFFKFGTLYDRINVSDIYINHDLFRQLSYAAGLWLSPSGGFVFFWFTFVFFLSFSGVHSLGNGWLGRSSSWVVGGVFLLLLGQTAGLSSWYAPFGWTALGPRLMLPWIPSVILILCFFFPGVLEKQRMGALPLSLLILGVSLPSFVAMVRPDFVGFILAPPPECPHPAVIQENASYYYSCLDHQIWPHQWGVLQLYRWILRPFSLLVFWAYFLVIFQAVSHFGQLVTDADGPDRS